MNIFLSVKKFIFGYDIFISYSRKDSLDYAYSIARHFMQKKFGYECYIDQLSSTTPGKELPKNIVSALQKSTAFIIIGSEGSKHSVAIAEEVHNFKAIKSNNPIIPISIGDNLFEADWFPEIQGLAVIREAHESFEEKQASDAILERIHNSLTFTKKSQKLRRATVSLAAIFGIILLATLWIFDQLGNAQDELTQTIARNKYEMMRGMITRSRVNADSNSISALKHALKAYLDFKDIDTAHIAEQNLVDLYNNYPITIKKRFLEGGHLSPGGKYILDGNTVNIVTGKEELSRDIYFPKFSKNDEVAVSIDGHSVKIYRMNDGSMVRGFNTQDSSFSTEFSSNNSHLFVINTDQGHTNNRIRAVDMSDFRISADAIVPGKYSVNDFYNEKGGGHFLLTNPENAGEGPTLFHVPSGTFEKLYPGDKKPGYEWSRYSYTSDKLILEQSVGLTKLPVIFKNALAYHFGVRLLDLKGNIRVDSVYEYKSYFTDVHDINEAPIYHSRYNGQLLFGLLGFWGQNFLLNVSKRLFDKAQRLRLGTGLAKDHKSINLLNSEYLLAASILSDEYRLEVYKITGSLDKPILTVLNKNNLATSPGDDSFMKSLDVSFSSSSNFLIVYDRGLGNCTMYYLDKKPVKTAKEFIELVSEKKIFGEVWNEIQINESVH